MRTQDHRARHAWDRRLGAEQGYVESVVHGTEAWRQAQRGEISADSYWRAVGDALGLGGAALAQLRADFYSGDRLDEQMVSLIRDLRARGVLVGLLSNNTPDLARELAELGLGELFDARIISAEVGAMKPDPQPYRHILARLGVRAQDAILVDDFPENVEGARAVGMAAILYRAGMDLRAALGGWLGIRL